MARPMNLERHMCVYCQKSRLYGPLRHTAPNEYSGTRVTTCLPCKKLRDKKGYNHEEMLRYRLGSVETDLRLMREHLQGLAARRGEYSPEFRGEFGDLAAKSEVRGHLVEVRRANASTLLKVIADWDIDDPEENDI